MLHRTQKELSRVGKLFLGKIGVRNLLYFLSPDCLKTICYVVATPRKFLPGSQLHEYRRHLGNVLCHHLK